MKWLQILLGGFGLNIDMMRLSTIEELLNSSVTETALAAAVYTMPNSKRQAIFQAVDHVYQHSDKSTEMVELPAGAPFGTAVIDESLCTLCMACVGACPGKALQDGSNREIPEVFFIESNCLQCGACVQTCPEDAIALFPRLVFDREARNKSRVLNQDVPFACIGCGKPFAPTSVIHKMQDRLKDHYMFGSSRALDRLKMCEDCRVADIVQDPEAIKGNFDPLN
ncbi:MAG: 4Fe-4S binding protein [Gammaproteobacteria bacterium]|nr:4Fe-4S binding protein [Gammaproteobacteria bacterium]